MSNATRCLAVLAVAVATPLLAGCLGEDEATKAGGGEVPVTLRLGTDDAPGRPAADQIEDLARRVEGLSEGALRIEPVWQAGGNGQPDWDQRVARLVTSGELDMGLIPSRAWDTEGVTSLRALNAPFLITSDQLLAEVIDGELAPEMLDGLDQAGVVGLALFPEGLRHVFGYKAPLLGPGDYAGKTIRSPTSKTTAAFFDALGATVSDEQPNPVAQAGIESSYLLNDAAGTATGNVTLWPKASALVVNVGVFDELDDDQRAILERAAAQTRERAIESLPSDTEAAKTFCENGGAVVLASDAQVAALEAAAAPVYDELEQDPQTKRFIDQIRALKSEVAASSQPAPCNGSDRGTETAGDSHDPSVLNGVWRANPTYEEGLAAGLSERTAAEEMGVETIRMENGRYDWRWLAKVGEQRCSGRYQVSGDLVVFTDPPDCGSRSWEARFELGDDEITWRAVKSHLRGDPEDQIVRELIQEPWTKIADVASAESGIPDGAYRAELTEEELVNSGMRRGVAPTYAGIHTLTLDDGRFTDEQVDDGVTTTCTGSYTSSGSQIDVSFEAPCEGGFTATYVIGEDALRFTDIEGKLPGEDQEVRPVFGAKPFVKVG